MMAGLKPPPSTCQIADTSHTEGAGFSPAGVYSARNAFIGSTVVARQAGPRHASVPAITNATATPANVSGSVGVV
jgi:hypothetical protein